MRDRNQTTVAGLTARLEENCSGLICTVALKGHYNFFFFLLKLSRDNLNLSRDKLKLSRDKMNSYRAINKKIIAR